MHNLNRVPTDIEEGLNRAAKKLHEPKRMFLRAHLEELRHAYADYNIHAANGTLHEMASIWKDADTDSADVRREKRINRNLASSLYGSKRPIINKHWEELKEANNSCDIMCPICGISDCTEMDHYIPVSVMHEYSVHLTNLIPLCHDCNHDKLDIWLDEDNNERLIFNAYFDRDIPQPVVQCNINLSETDGRPKMSVEMSPALERDNPLHRIVISTFDRLELLERYRSKIRIMFREELIGLKSQFLTKSRNVSTQERWNEIKRCYEMNLRQREDRDFLNLCMFTAIVQSQVMEQWFLGLSDHD